MSKVKYFINSREPGATDLANQMRQAGIDFSSLPTSGPLVLWIDGHACYGVTAVKYAVHQLIKRMGKLSVTFTYPMTGAFKVDTDMKASYVPDVIEAYIQDVMGNGKDATSAKELEVYHITLEIDLTDDTITIMYDCGNKGLANGILMDILGRLRAPHGA